MKKTPVDIPGYMMLEDSLLNKGSAFTQEEREDLGLEGLIPPHVSSIEQQVKRRYDNFNKQHDDLSRYIFLSALQNRNETLFYRLVSEHLQEMVPLIYTPTIGSVSSNFSLLYREQRGLYLSYPYRNHIRKMVQNFPREDVDVIVVTDGERILGLGDLGIGGMAISVGKLALYTLFGGIHPARTLPVILDVGTNNQEMLDDPLYIGWRNQRIRKEEYDAFIEEFVEAVKERYPNVLLQWEDFARPNALPLLKRYRDSICSFNDDIQGTASVALAAVYSALGLSKTPIKDHRFAVLGGGSAGIGICNQLAQAIATEEGMTEEEARKLFYIVDLHGLFVEDDHELDYSQRPFAHPKDEIAKWKVKDPYHITLMEVIDHVKPSVLIGVSTQGGAFTEEIVKTMLGHVERPMIFPLSNPTSRSEAHPADLIKWTKGKAIIATGSPFDPVIFDDQIYQIAQCNNVYIFPGVGLGLIATKATFASDAVFINAAKVLAGYSPMVQDPYAPLFPSLDRLRKVTREIGIAVAKTVIEEGNSHLKETDSVEKLIDETMWYPDYPIYYRS